MSANETKREIRETHPVETKKVSTLMLSWETWLKRWEEELSREHPSAEVLIGLLHFAFPRTHQDNVILCFEIANGYDSEYNFSDKENGLISHSFDRSATGQNREWRPRYEVTRKAWRMLCDNFFQGRDREHRLTESWWQIGLTPKVFAKYLWFFDPRRENIPPRDSRDHYDQIALEHLRAFVRFVWHTGHEGNCSYELVRRMPHVPEMCRKARPELLEIFAAMGELDWLLGRDPEEFDKNLLGKLKETALRRRVSYEKGFETIEEAAAQGVQAARILILLEVNRREYDRQKAIAEAKCKAKEAQERLAELSSRK